MDNEKATDIFAYLALEGGLCGKSNVAHLLLAFHTV
jgi:hypothetical protein